MTYGPRLQKLLEDYDRHLGMGYTGDGTIPDQEERSKDIYDGFADGNVIYLNEIFQFACESRNAVLLTVPEPKADETLARSIGSIIKDILPWPSFKPRS